jgi:hypothetical protein
MNSLNPHALPYQKGEKYRFTKDERDYFKWLHDEATCCLTGQTEGIQLAHVGGLAEGKGMSIKCDYRFCLPIFWKLHQVEESQRDQFWRSAGFPDYKDWAVRLHDLYTTGQPKAPLIFEMYSMSNKAFLTEAMTL